MSSGFVKLHRCVQNSWIYKDTVCFHVFFGWFLPRTAWEVCETEIHGQTVTLLPGQVIGGRKMIADALDLTEKQVRNALERLTKHGSLGASTRASTRASIGASTRASTFTLYNVMNWGTYQTPEQMEGPAKSAELEEEIRRLRAILLEVEEVKEVKKKKGADALRDNPLVFLETFPEEFQTSEPFKAAWAKWVQHRKESGGKPIHKLKTGSAETIRQLGELTPEHAAEVITHSLRNGYQGLFPEKVASPTATNDPFARMLNK